MTTTKESLLLSKVRELEKWVGFETNIKWSTSFNMLAYHIFAVYWCYNYAVPVKWQSIVFAYAMYIFSGFGVTGGAHRYWTHRTFKATTPLRIIFLLGFAAANQSTLYQWIRSHRIHHKYSDTDSDPHNINRGFFFSHIGWVFMETKPEVTSKFSITNMADIESDPLVQWQAKYVNIINPLACYIVPTLIGIFLLGESWQATIAWQCFIRVLIVYHSELTINSIAHSAAFGYRPYNKDIKPVENAFVAALTGGEGWHNYHHAFPFDYKSAETITFLDTTTILLNLAEKLGWMYDKKEASKDMIQKYKNRAMESEFNKSDNHDN